VVVITVDVCSTWSEKLSMHTAIGLVIWHATVVFRFGRWTLQRGKDNEPFVIVRPPLNSQLLESVPDEQSMR